MNAPAREATKDRDAIRMPTALTPAMRSAAEAVRTPITVFERPYLDQVYDALIEAVRKEQKQCQ